MPRGFGLSFLTRRSDRSAGSGRDAAPVARRASDADSAAVGPPALLPSMIYHERLFDASELPPAWARPRDTSRAAAPADRPADETAKPKRTRRPRATAASATPAASPSAPAKPKRARKARPPSS